MGLVYLPDTGQVGLTPAPPPGAGPALLSSPEMMKTRRPPGNGM